MSNHTPRRPRRSATCLVILLAATAFISASSRVDAQPPAAADDGADAVDPDFYKAPTGDADALAAFISKLINHRPRTRKEALSHQKKVLPAIRGAAKELMESDENSKHYKIGESVLLQIDMQEIANDTKADAKPVVERALAFVKKSGKDASGFEIQLLMELGRALEYTGDKRRPLAEQVYADGAAMLKEAANPQVREYADRLAGMGRRLGLPGKQIQLAGATYAGEKFDIASLKGKVVLVDFWATWCQPCLQEIPNMLANYERFHEHGFEIVGVSIDENRGALDEFMKAGRVPWTILHENDGTGSNPAADYYGIQSIPAMFLVDRDGVVLSISARGPELTELLEKQFPKVVAAEKAKEAAAAKE